MWIEISKEEYAAYEKDRADLAKANKEIVDLNTKNSELWENIKKSKDSLSEKHNAKLLEVTTEKEKLENQFNELRTWLWITDETDVSEFIKSTTENLSKYWEIQLQQKQAEVEKINHFTEFLNSKDPEYLKTKTDIFWEWILENPKALEDFAKANWYDDKGWEKKIEVGKIENQVPWKQTNNFNSAMESWDVGEAKKSFISDLLK